MKDNSFQAAIKSYLDERAKADELFAKAYAKSNKNLKECCDFIMGEAKKRGNAVAMTDDEVFGLAVHYYDEDNIKVNKVSGSYKVSAPASAPVPKVELTEEDKKKAREEAIRRLTEERYASIKKKPNKRKEEDVQQMSLF
ncbi:PcfK-like family protein [Bacteroides fragilis]|uniref:PcfK-like family protein n=1 Tax=Bacteroides fragilis TaxID=817 RepID=UPI0022AB4C56|nr:PcfK-like family protein [Bacteroides fragilis]MCZ2602696.1 PcfK-like family protein [Bacteroides fragilis]